MRQTLIAKVENKPGVLNRVASLFRRRNFNIDSLNVGRTEDPDISRMTLTIDSNDVEARLVEANLYKLVNVVDVVDVTGQNAILRELALVKVSAEPAQRSEITSLCNIFHATIEDVQPNMVIVQITASENKVDSLLELLRPFGIIESVRTGHVAMMRGEESGIRHTPNAQGYSNGVAN